MPKKYNKPQNYMQIPQTLQSYSLDFNVNQMTRDLTSSKEDLTARVRHVLQRKQLQVRQQIDKINAQSLLILQKKVLMIEKKNEQIFALNKQASLLKNQFRSYKTQLQNVQFENLQFKARFKALENSLEQANNVSMIEKEKRHQLRKEYDKINKIYKINRQQKQQAVREMKKAKDQVAQFDSKLNLLLKNHKEIVSKDHKKQIDKLQSQNHEKILSQQSKVQSEKNISFQLKKDLQAIKRQLAQANEKIMKGQKEIKVKKEMIDIETQTEVLKIKNDDFGCNVEIQCEKCQEIEVMIMEKVQPRDNSQQQCKKKKNLYVPKVNRGVQVKVLQNKQTKNQGKNKIIKDNQSQTFYKIQSSSEQLELQTEVKNLILSSKRACDLKDKKYQQLEDIMYNQPSKPQDIQKILNLKKQKIELQLQMIENTEKIQNLEDINKFLHIQLKFNRKQIDKKQLEIKSTKNWIKREQNSPRLKKYHYSLVINKKNNENILLYKIIALLFKYKKRIFQYQDHKKQTITQIIMNNNNIDKIILNNNVEMKISIILTFTTQIVILQAKQ